MYSNFPPFFYIVENVCFETQISEKAIFQFKMSPEKGIFLNTVRMFQFKINLDRSVISSFQTLLIL